MHCGFSISKAEALVLGGKEAPNIFGTVHFYQKSNCVLVVADIKGLPKNESGFYGFHIHSGPSCAGVAFSQSESHYNPENTTHPNHAGDLPPLMLCGDMAHLQVLTDRFTVSEIIGKTVIIHNMPDDFKIQPSGNAGDKIACGVIRTRPAKCN